MRKRCALIFHPREFWNLLIQAKFSKLPHFSAFKIETVKHMIKRTKIVDGFLSPPPVLINVRRKYASDRGGRGHIWDNGTRTGKISMLVCFLLKSMEPVGKIFTSSD